MSLILFLDFDGVLRRVDSPAGMFDAECLACFEDAVRNLPPCEIVISSSWREREAVRELRARFSPDIAARITAAVPFITYPADFPRHREVLAYLENRGIGGDRWIAIEDDPSAYPKECAVVMTDPARGFDAAAARKLIRLAGG